MDELKNLFEMGTRLFKNSSRRVKRLRLPKVRSRTFRFQSTVGFEIQGKILSPLDHSENSGLLMCPDATNSMDSFNDMESPCAPEFIAAMGFTVMLFDPAGRGKSWGNEDLGGEEHQEEVACALRILSEEHKIDEIGVLALGDGAAMAMGGIQQSNIQVKALIDWESPADRKSLRIPSEMKISRTINDDKFWHPREPVELLKKLPCPYIRLQSCQDHISGDDLRSARKMLWSAKEGITPWFQLNTHPKNKIPERPRWLNSGKGWAMDSIMDKLNNIFLRSPS